MIEFFRKWSGQAASAGFAVAGLAAGLSLLAGCPSQSSEQPSASPPAAKTAAFHGSVYGGRQPISGATIVAYASGTSSGAAPTQIGQTYSGPDGTFTISTFAPAPRTGQTLYVVASGGTAATSGSPNTAIELMTVAGIWGSTLAPVAATVNINELSTVASTAALQDYIHLADCSTIIATNQSGTCVSIPGALDLARMSATVNNLVNVVKGQASDFLATNAQTAGAPFTATLEKLDTLANILAGCVNAASGSTAASCTALFEATGGANNTLAAALQIAADPLVNERARALFQLQAATIYSPPLATVPGATQANFWTVGGQRFALATNTDGNDVSVWRLGKPGGPLIANGSISVGDSQSSSAVDPTGRFVYATNPIDNVVFEFTVNPDGTLTANGSIAAGNAPQSVTVDPTGRYVYVANYDSSSLSAYTINPDGTLAANGSIAAGGLPISVAVDPTGRYVYAASRYDNTVSEYRINPDGTLAANGSIAAGDLPGWVAVDPTGRFVYVANSRSNTISEYRINPDGTLTSNGSISTGVGPTGVAVDPTGRFVYSANQLDNTVSEFTVNPDGTLAANGEIASDSGPWSVAVDPTDQYVYVNNYSDNSVSAYTINADGTLAAAGNIADSSQPNSVTVDPTGHYVYVTHFGRFAVSEYRINPGTGDSMFSAVGVPTPTGAGPTALAVDTIGGFIYAANHGGAGSASISGYKMDPASGVLAEFQGVTGGSYSGANSIAVDPTGRYAYVAYGDNFVIAGYAINPDGTFIQISDSGYAGGTPYAIAVDPTGHYAYATNSANQLLEYRVVQTPTPNTAAGALAAIGGTGNNTVPAGADPQSLAVDPTGRYVYVAARGTNRIYAYRIVQTAKPGTAAGALAAIGGTGNNFVATGAQPKGIAVGPTGRFVYVANQGDGTASEYAINPATGGLTELPDSPVPAGTGPNAVTVDPTGDLVYVSNDDGTVSVYALDSATGQLTHYKTLTAGSGPDALVLSPAGRFLYVANHSGNTVSTYALDRNQAFAPVAGSACNVTGPDPANCFATGNAPRSVAMDPTGRYAYVANIHSDTVSEYAISPATGTLIPIGSITAGDSPNSVAVDPTGRFVYVTNQLDETVSGYTINPDGTLTANGSINASRSPFAVTVDPFGRFVFVANSGAGTVWSYQIKPDGTLNPGISSNGDTGANPVSVAVDPSGRYAYVAVTSGSISERAIAADGQLVANGSIAAGAQPISVAVDPTGRYVYVVDYLGNSILEYIINSDGTLALNPNGDSISAGTGPNSIMVDPTGRHVRVTKSGDNTVSVYAIQADGTLTEVSGSPFPAGNHPLSIISGP